MDVDLHHPASVADAVALAARLGESARFVAGGTDLVIQMARGRAAPAHLIDITRLPGLEGIVAGGDAIVIGALTTHKSIERHAPFQRVRRPYFPKDLDIPGLVPTILARNVA